MSNPQLSAAAPELIEAAEAARERRDLLVLQVGSLRLGVFADEADNVTRQPHVTPLPHAPAAIIGITSVRGGRILTVLDPLALFDESQAARAREQQSPEAISPPFIIALRGDEQLALAVHRAERIIEIFLDEIEPLAHEARTDQAGEMNYQDQINPHLVRGIIRLGLEAVIILELSELFSTATQSIERRRQRS